MRRVFLWAARNRWLKEHLPRMRFMRRAVRRFMPGETLGDALGAAVPLQAVGIRTMYTRLGENLTDVAEANEVADHYVEVIDQIVASGIDGEVSVKPTQLGLDLDRALCQANLERLVDRAAALGNFLWIDMESSLYVDPTLALFRAARARSSQVGIALQAYLRRTVADVETLLPLGCAIRLVKGAYLEPPAVAFPKKSDVDENFYALCCRLLAPAARAQGTLLHIGTHDEALVGRLERFIDDNQVPRDTYEFAMLYGIQRPLQLRLARAGRRLRVLISYGEYWFPWYMRRLAERPANIMFVAKNVFR